MKDKKNSKVFPMIGLVMCLVFGVMLICNLAIIIQGILNPERPPSILGVTPMVVLSGSMSGEAEGHVEIGDLILVGKTETEELESGDVIAFMEKGSNIVITHRIVEVTQNESGECVFITKGDANNAQDAEPVEEAQVIGIVNSRIPKVGDFAMFLQSPLGMLIFIGIPVVAFLAYDLSRRQRAAKADKRKNEEMEAELARLRALAGEDKK